MNVRLIVAGKPALAYAKAGVEEYLKRLSRFGGYELVIVKAGDRDEVSARLLERSHGCYRIALDERGERLSTRAFADKLDSLALRGDVKTVAFLIGAADGHNRRRCARQPICCSPSRPSRCSTNSRCWCC